MHERLQVVEVTEGLVVTMPGTQFLVAYRKLARPPWLLSTEFVDDIDGPLPFWEFANAALSAGIQQARELGWITE